VPAQWWDACKVDSIPDIGRRGVIIGLDAARANDCFALVVVTSKAGKVQVIYHRIWTPPEGGQIKYDEIEVELIRLFKLYSVVEVAYDPTDLTSMSQRLGQLVYWREFLQAQPRAVADKLLYDLIRDRRIEHRGEPDLREHVLNANSKPEDEKIRIVKRTQMQKIDACVALSQAADRALSYNL
jgi:phage terminase large subunit-like protein